MENSATHFLVLGIVLLLQLAYLAKSKSLGKTIRNIFPATDNPYEIEGTENEHLIRLKTGSPDLTGINKEINKYLGNHYANNRTPDIAQIFLMVKERSRIHDSLAGYFATIPILIGLAGTVSGLFLAFFNFNAESTAEGSKFLSIISKSSSIAFIGTLGGILCTIHANSYINHCKKERDINMNIFISFLNTQLSPRLPTLKDETAAIVASTLNTFSREYFDQFRIYTNEFKEINKQISQLYQNGLKGVIERNSLNLEKLNQYIEKLDMLNDVTRKVTIKPAMIAEFSDAATRLVQSLEASSLNHKEHVRYLEDILTAYKRLEDQAHNDIRELIADKQVFANYGEAIQSFVATSEQRMKIFAHISESFDQKIETLSNEYLHTIGVIKSQLVDQVEKNFNSDAYVDFAQKIQSIQSSVEKESENIRQLAGSFAELNEKISGSLVPAFTQTSAAIGNMNSFLRNDLPVALKKTIEANKKMVMQTSEQLLGEPNSWGQWTFKLAKNMFKRKKNDEE